MEKFEEDLIKLKNKINSMTLSDEFKENLSKKLDMEYEKIPDKKHFFIPKQLVAACACCIVLTSCVFADSIGSAITNLFANTSKEMEAAIESGELQSLNMDYVERDGVSIKIDYAMAKDDSLYLVFNILSEEEINKVKFDDYELKNVNGDVIYSKSDFNFREIDEVFKQKRLNNKELMLFTELYNVEKIKEQNKLNMKLNKINLERNGNREYIDEEWNFEIYLDK